MTHPIGRGVPSLNTPHQSRSQDAGPILDRPDQRRHPPVRSGKIPSDGRRCQDETLRTTVTQSARTIDVEARKTAVVFPASAQPARPRRHCPPDSASDPRADGSKTSIEGAPLRKRDSSNRTTALPPWRVRIATSPLPLRRAKGVSRAALHAALRRLSGMLLTQRHTRQASRAAAAAA
jgi:hypothetical protein